MHRRDLPLTVRCHAQWDAMAPTDGDAGRKRHCAACDRVVVDLSAHTALGARLALATHAAPCVRFTTTARGRVQFDPMPRWWPLAAWLTAAVTALAAATSASAAPEPVAAPTLPTPLTPTPDAPAGDVHLCSTRTWPPTVALSDEPLPVGVGPDRSGVRVTTHDVDGLGFPFTTLTLTSATGTERTVTGDDAGAAAIADLPPGLYTVEVAPLGIAPVTLEAVTLNAGRTERIDFTFPYGEDAAVMGVLVRRSWRLPRLADLRFRRRRVMDGPDGVHVAVRDPADWRRVAVRCEGVPGVREPFVDGEVTILGLPDGVACAARLSGDRRMVITFTSGHAATEVGPP